MGKTDEKRLSRGLYILTAIMAAVILLGGCGKTAPQNTPTTYTEERTATPEEQAFIKELFAEATKNTNKDTFMSGSVDFDIRMSLLGRIKTFGFSCTLQSEREGNTEHSQTELTIWTEGERHTETGESYARKDGEELYTVYSRKDNGAWACEKQTSFGLFNLNELVLTAIPETCTIKEENNAWVVSGLVNADDITTALEDNIQGNDAPSVNAEASDEDLGELLKAKVTFRFNKETGALMSYIIDLREPLLAFSDKLSLEDAAGVTNPILARILRSFLHIDLSACCVHINEIKQDPTVRVNIPEEVLSAGK